MRRWVRTFFLKRGFFGSARVLVAVLASIQPSCDLRGIEKVRWRGGHGLLTFYLFRVVTKFRRQHTDSKAPYAAGYAQGFSFDKKYAMAKCVGEYLERFPFLEYTQDQFLLASTLDLVSSGRTFVHPSTLATFSQAQMEVRNGAPLSAASMFHWDVGKEVCVANNVVVEKDIYLPAQALYWSYNRSYKGYVEPQIREIGTHGGAGYVTKDGALLRALYELIGRHLFFKAWLSEASPSRIALDSLPREGELAKKCEWVTSAGYVVHLLYTGSMHGVHSIFCILQRRGSVGAVNYSFGAGGDHDLVRACDSALEEALSLVFWIGTTLIAEESLPPISSPELWNDRERLSFFQTSRGGAALSKFLNGETMAFNSVAGGGRDSTTEESATLSSLLTELVTSTRGIRIFYKEANHPLLEQFGFFSVKVVATGLIPMFHYMSNLPERAVAETLGIEELKHVPPHPFP